MAADQLPSVPEALAHSGWLATGILAAWGWITRVAMGRHFKAIDEMSKSIGSIDKRLARIEGRFEEKDHTR